MVENIRDVIAIESTQHYSGTYHVLNGIISPLDGIGPEQLHIETLVARIEKEQTEELIFALNPNIQGDTTIYYIQKKINHLPCRNLLPAIIKPAITPIISAPIIKIIVNISIFLLFFSQT